MARARAFYESVFQLSLQDLGSPDMDMWSFPMNMESTGASGALVRMEGMPSGGNSTLVYFSCADCALEAARAVAAGGQLQREKMAIGEHGFIALAQDTEGNMFGLHSMQ
jgi:predicted enzyme related to lactoylglutathione lyase